MSEFDVLIMTAAGAVDPALAIAGSRAGALGVLNLEFGATPQAVERALEQLERHARGAFGVLLDADDEPCLESVLIRPRPGLATVAFTGGDEGRLRRHIAAVRRRDARAILVVTSIDEAVFGQALGFDALIAKGNEAGGWVGDETAFVLLQRLSGRVAIPVYLQGGIGLHTAAAAYVGGAAGVVLDNQLLLARESPLPETVRRLVSAMDGSETACFGSAFGAPFRAYARAGLPAIAELRQLEARLTADERPAAEKRRAWREALRPRAGWQQSEQMIAPLGQDAAFAGGLAARFRTVGGIVIGVRQAIQDQCASARRQGPLAEGAPLAQAHGTRYPIVQGPMTRVSDRAEFAAAVAGAGALPFLALALMRGPEIEQVLQETRERLAGRPWGVGILGFVPAELRAEQLAIVRRYRPPFALIAGGRPDQTRALESDGTTTYLHVPSPGLLRMFLRDGARRFVFEGRECGGHVGPRASLVLWDMMIDVLLDHLSAGGVTGEFNVLFAGGIHDGLSAAMVAALAAPLVERGVRIGVLLGTAYLFTQEAVATGAIVSGFQQAALACRRTSLLESGPGQATRCAPSPFVDDFETERRRLVQSGATPEALRNELELLNIGRLRIAAKGVDRDPRFGQDPAVPKLVAVAPEEQWARGMYMIGQVAALRDRVCTLAELHAEVSAGSVRRLAAFDLPSLVAEPAPPKPAAVAIVGMGCILPGAPDLPTFWANILNKVDAVTEVPADRWDWRQYYDADRAARDKVYSRWGGFIADVPFDPVDYGMPPRSLHSIEPFQLLGLAVVRAALKDAGYADRPFPRERTSVILGAGGGGGELASGYVFRSSLPQFFGEDAADLTNHLDGRLPEWTEDSFAGLLMNVAAGRVANRFDLGGVNYTVDAACASSLAAVYLAVRDLEAGTSDVAIVGGVDAIQGPFAYLCFSKTQALSPTGRCRTFDAQADGIAISEGFAALVLKRLDDAERDGDRIYGVIRGVGASSDGRDRSLTAPRPEGQVRALRRAYDQAGFSPATVELVEAHGTGTVAGDQAEVQALSTFFDGAGAARQSCAIGSVKSMIGHTKATAGVASLTKTALALHHRVLPPTLGVTQPNPKANFEASPLYVNTEPRPWVRPAEAGPRRAGVSAFGFGGTDFHVALEEYTGDYLPSSGMASAAWPAELLIWRGTSATEILGAITALAEKLEQGAKPRLGDLAYTLALQAAGAAPDGPTLAIVADSPADLQGKLAAARTMPAADPGRQHGPQGIRYAPGPLSAGAKTAFLFPGQGSQYVNMGRDLAVAFPDLRAGFEQADQALADRLERPLSSYLFPPPVFRPDDEQRQLAALTETNIAQPALGAVDLALLRLLGLLGVEADMVAGHSYGEFVALCAAGCFSEETLLLLSEARGRFIREGAVGEAGTMAAIDATPAELGPLLADLDITLANLNAPRQTVISGAGASVAQAVGRCKERGLRARILPVACAFHSPLVAPAQQRLAALLQQTPMAGPTIPVYSNTTAAAYPDDPAAIIALLSEHLTAPVNFVAEIEAMYAAGARVFVEVGPRNVLSGLVDRILGDRPHASVPLDQAGRPALAQLLHGLAALAVEGVPLDVERLFADRAVRRLDLATVEEETGRPRYTATTWLVNGSHARPAQSDAAGPQALPAPLRISALNGVIPTAAPPPATPERALSPLLVARPSPNGHDRTAPGRPPSLDGSQVLATAGQNGVGDGHSGTIASLSHPGPASTSGTGPADGGRAPAPMAPDGIAGRSGADGRQAATVAAPRSRRVLGEEMKQVPSITGAAGLGTTDRAAQAMQQFQQVMQHFLETQQRVMLAFLGAPSAPALARGLDTAPGAAAIGAPLPAFNGQPPQAELAKHGMLGTPAAPPRPPEPQPPSERPLPVVGEQIEVSIGAGDNGGVAASVVASAVLSPSNGERGRIAPAAAAASVAVAPSVVATDVATGPALSRRELTERLLAIVSDRTGYPAEMLGLDADMEADLGIDSIKRVEIAGTIVQSLALPPDHPPDMEKLAASRSLTQVIDHLEALCAPPAPATMVAVTAAPAEREAVRLPFDDEPAARGIGRFVLQPHDAPLLGAVAGLAPTGVAVIVDDGAGVGARLAGLLGSRGYRSIRVTTPEGHSADAEVLLADTHRPEAVTQLVTAIHERYGNASALIHLAALRPGDETIGSDGERWRARLASDLEALFLLTQALQADLAEAAANGGAAVLAATRLGGVFAVETPPAAYFPGQAAVTGYMKTLAQEWPTVRIKAVDLSPAGAAQTAELLLAELLADDGLVEVGYRAGQRSRLELVPAPLPDDRSEPALDRESVLLVTGGARGITAEAAQHLAQEYHPTVIVVGRTTLPTGAEEPDIAGLHEPAALKRALIERKRQAGQPVTPLAIEASYQQILNARELRQNLAALQRHAGRLAYFACDVRDAGAFGALIDEIYRTYGRIDGVIHGAGVIEDKLVRDKKLDSFRRVVETKVNGAVTLAAKLRPESLRFLVFFSSVSGRFGNRGQADYAAANEALNKLAQDLDRRWPGRVVAINWGPWLKTGMVSAEVQRQFAQRGVTLIPVDVGCRRLAAELRSGRKGDVEVLIGAVSSPQAPARAEGDTRASGDQGTAPADRRLPLLASRHTRRQTTTDAVDILRTLDVEHDRYLRDHRIDGHPVLPFAVAIELLAETAQSGWPDFYVTAVRQIRLLRGVTVDGEQPVRLVARHIPSTPPTADVTVQVTMSAPDDPRRQYYQALVDLDRPGSTRRPESLPREAEPWQIGEAGPLPMSVADAYQQLLFHGPMFQGIESVSAFGPAGARAVLRPSSPQTCLRGDPPGDWLIDPILVDSAFQMQVIWARLHWDVTLLPAGVQAYRRFPVGAAGPSRLSVDGPSAQVHYELRIRPESRTPLCHADHYFTTTDGRLLGMLSDVEGAGSKALNRLAGSGQGAESVAR